MLSNPFVFVLGMLALIFSMPLLAIWTEHRRKMVELTARLKAQSSSGGQAQDQMRDLGRQLAELRSTATEFDLSFDAALQRLESRMDLMDERLKRLEGVRASEPVTASEQVRLGAR
ncbi:MAG: hypothetical protein FJX72_12965 [Armatimonadetes bacterium]|nr:hypothetical protein [Armatimonadota bacterium]